jgi:hypothetical protein
MSRRAYDAYWAAPASLDRHVAETMVIYQTMLGRRGRQSTTA